MSNPISLSMSYSLTVENAETAEVLIEQVSQYVAGKMHGIKPGETKTFGLGQIGDNEPITFHMKNAEDTNEESKDDQKESKEESRQEDREAAKE